MTHAPRSGSGRNSPRGGNGPRKPGKAFGAPAGGGRPGKAGGKDQGFKPGQPGRPAAGKGQPGGTGAGKTQSGRPGPGKAQSGRPAAGKGQPGRGAGAASGPRPFGQERFGQNLGPVRNRPRPVRSGQGETSELHNPEGVRLQKVMASAGVASRRVCEELIEAGRVEVDGVVVRELGVRVDPARAVIHVDGIRIQTNEALKYLVFNKPKGVVCTMEDPEGRPCISDYLKKHQGERLFHVGRLDQATEGLLLLTNDGELANRLTHPSYEVPKTYLVQVRGPMAHGIGARMKQGIELEDGLATVDSFKLVDSTPGHVLVEVVLHSGKNRVVRRMFEAVGHPVERLVRTQIGPIGLGNQRQGSIRALGRQEVGHLLALVGM
ncbi:pseudouridine synthase [Arthrobacter mobilis]|uniref:Pseudouridine synthase n=1 Tax=Arthrobacter mobilis TaxID=2724944 RepID=A0A7X6HDG6_9MICC|nr:pseudouridine synthase [Arthrobacter mobilis]NKX54976.1 rRNA pseudouridine synthase [Arthrobacter mobilis]